MSFGPSGINSPPEGGVCPPLRPSFGGLRASLAASRPPPRAAPRRGKIPPAPLGRAGPPPAWPERPTRLPPPICRPGGKASEARRPKAGGLFGLRGKFQKVGQCEALRGVPGGVPPGAVEGWSTGLSRWAVSGQRAALSTPSTGDPGCPRRNGPQGAYCVQREKGNAGNPRQC